MDNFKKIMSETFNKEVWLDKEDKEVKVNIEGIPIMISDKGEIICLPDLRDCPVIQVTGQRGSGKTTLLHNILDRMHKKYSGYSPQQSRQSQKMFCWLNDRQGDTLTYYKPNYIHSPDNYPRELNILNEKPRPLPMVYLYPNTRTLIYEKEIDNFKMSIPYKEILENSEDYYKLEKSGFYLKNMIKDLINLKSFNEIFAYFEALKEEKEESKSTKKESKEYISNMLYKLSTFFSYIIREKIIDINEDESIAELEIDGIKLNPIIAFASAGAIPSVLTSDLMNKKYFHSLMRYYIEQIFSAQEKYFKDREIWVFIDELQELCSDENTKESLNRLVSQGRPQRIATVASTINYTKIPDPIRVNAQYLFTFRHNDKREVNEIIGNWNLKESDKVKIMGLKKHQIMAVTSEYFIVYKNGKKFTSEELGYEKIFGKSLPPLSKHKAPKEEV